MANKIVIKVLSNTLSKAYFYWTTKITADKQYARVKEESIKPIYPLKIKMRKRY